MPSEHTPTPETNIPSEETVGEPAFVNSPRDCAVFLKRDQLSTTPAVPAETMTAVRGKSTRDFTVFLKKILPVPAVLALLSGVCWGMTCLSAFDWGIGHIAGSSVWFAAALACLILGLGCTAMLMIPARRTRQYRFPTVGLAETFCSFFTAAMLGIRGFRLLYEQFTTAPESAAMVNTALLGKLAAVGMFVCAAYFLCLGLGRRGAVMTVLSMGSCLGVMLVLFRDYFDFTLPLNSPLRNFAMLAWAALLLFFIAETRVHVDLWYTGTAYTVFTYCFVILICGTVGLGQAIAAFAGCSSFNLIGETAFLAAAALAFFRLKSLPSLLGDHLPPPPTEEEVKKAEKKLKK